MIQRFNNNQNKKPSFLTLLKNTSLDVILRYFRNFFQNFISGT
jgi:hypothetical protein